MSSSTSAKCRNCKKPIPPDLTGPCPHCGKSAGKDVVVGISEHIDIHDTVSVTTETRREQFQKKPYKIYFAVALLIAGVVVAFIDHDLSLPLGIILGINGVGQTPINEKTIITIRERH